MYYIFDNYKIFIDSTHIRVLDINTKDIYDGIIDYNNFPYLGIKNNSIKCANINEYLESIDLLFIKYNQFIKIKYIDDIEWRNIKDSNIHNNELFIHFESTIFNYTIRLNKLLKINNLIKIFIELDYI